MNDGDDSKGVIRRFFDDVLNGGRLALLDQMIAGAYIEHNPTPNQAPGAAGVRARIAAMRTAFPDVRFVVEEIIAEGPIVAARYRWQGTHEGAFLGIAPTGRRLSVRGMEFYRVEGGRVLEHWDLSDEFGMLTQLGDLG
jgi:steroid delta-isomerase-like uncharacterized protein